MHIVTRQVNEGLVIDGKLHVTVLEVHDDRVRLAFSLPGEDTWEEVLYLEGAESACELQVH